MFLLAGTVARAYFFYLRAPSARAGNKLLTIKRPQTRRRQQRRPAGNSKAMIFGCEHLVWYCSQFFVLEPGDVMEMGIEGLGVQRQKIVPFKM